MAKKKTEGDMAETEMRAEPEQAPKSMNAAGRPAGDSAVGRALRALLRLVLVVLLGAALGVAGYFGALSAFRSLDAPTRLNAQRVADLETELSLQQQHAQDEATRIDRRLAALETQLAGQAEQLSELQAGLDELEGEAGTQQGMERQLASLQAEVDRVKANLGQAQMDLEDLEASVAEEGTPTEELLRQLQLVRAMELLARARLNLINGNLGLAKDDLTAARDSLTTLREAASEEEAALIAPVVERLDMALNELDASSTVAADDLEIAWKLLVQVTAP